MTSRPKTARARIARARIAPPLVVKPGDWPALDQRLWAQGTQPSGSILDTTYAETLRPKTLRNAACGYGRLLAVLRDLDRLDPDVMPADRLTPEMADHLLRALHGAGNINNTIKARIWEIRQALRIMQPDVNTTWLTRPGDTSLHMLLPTTPPHHELFGHSGFHDLAMTMLATADDQPTARQRHLQRRNGLILAILTAHAPRVATLAAMRVGIEVQLKPDACWLVLKGDIVKNDKTLEYRTPPELLPHIRRYLTETRPALLAGAVHDAMWVCEGGKPFDLIGISAMFRRLTKAKFDRGTGPHQSRRELVSALADAEPDNSGLGAAILGINPATAEQYYNFARNDRAAERVADHLESERERTRLLAERLFAEGR